MKMVLMLALCAPAWTLSVGYGNFSQSTPSQVFNGLGTFSFGGEGFTATGMFNIGPWGGCGMCVVGNAYTPSLQMAGNSILTGSASLGQDVFPSVTYISGPGILRAIADPLIMAPGTHTGNFNFNGQLCGRVVHNAANPGPCDVELNPLLGAGTYTVTFSSVPDSNFLQQTAASYDFSAPEPATWLLMLAGLAILRRLKPINAPLD